MAPTDDHPVTLQMTGKHRDEVADLYIALAPDVGRLAYLMNGDPVVAEDIAQEAFVRLLARLPHVETDASRAYLMRIVINLSKNHRRQKATEKRALQILSRRQGSSIFLPEATFANQLLSDLQALPRRQRAAVVLRYCEDLSEKQTAELMAISPKAVRSLVGRAMAALRLRVEGEGHG